ncbi:MAG: hypothetical protein Q9182_007471 [Xanthomendoza sp. 2 TL-2023]
MPRPKRTKLPPSIPINPVATASRKPQNDIHVSPAVSSSRRTNGSDDSEGIVTKSKTGVNRRGIAPQAVFMSGALAVEDEGATRPRPMSSRKRVELSRIARDGDYATACQKIGLRQDADLAGGRLQKHVQKADVQIQLPNATVAPVQTAKIQATPMRENSVLATENFRRRPRQPSLLQIAQAHHAAVDSENDGTLNDFNPDDESTPFGKSALDIHLEPPTASPFRHPPSRKRKLSTPDIQDIQVQASQSLSSPAHNSSPPPSVPDDLFDIFAEDSQPKPSLPTIPSSRSALPPQPVDSDTLAPPQSSSMPPSPQKQALQSKSHTEKVHSGSKPTLKPTNPKVRQQSSPVLPPRSPTPTQSSPTAVPATRPLLKPLTTSTLQNLLPRRRRVVSSNKGNTVFDIHSSSGGEMDTLNADEDEDELNYRPTTTKLARNGATEKKPKRGKPKAAKNKSKIGADAAGAQIRVPRLSTTTTYGRKHVQDTVSENENVALGSESDEDGGSAGVVVVKMDGKAREELKRMAAKFREVDEWGLEFEEVTGSSDRMRDAR